jgi:TRAP-type mannitol/chloroaromatic compound transport system permease large subunit
MDINMVWFLVVVGLNMSMSFLTPPFGFALFYLRSVAPKSDYKDEITGRLVHGMKTMEIYRGAIPFILIMLTSLVLIIVFPEIVTFNLDAPLDVDLDTIEITIDGMGGGDDPWGADASDPWAE